MRACCIAASGFCAGFGALAPALAGPNVIVNGSFESGLAPGVVHQGSTAIDGWLVVAEDIDYVSATWPAADGLRSLDLNGDGAAGAIEQTFQTTPGASYLVTFALAGNAAGPPVVKHVNVSAVGRSQSFSFDTTGHTLASMGWEDRVFAFVASDAISTLVFASLDTADPILFGAAIDNVRVEAMESIVNPTNGHSYALTPERMTWQDARTVATSIGGYLLSLTNAAEESWVDVHVVLTPESVWLGYTDGLVEGEWRWESGEPTTYTHWMAGEPNDFPSSPAGEDYALTSPDFTGWSDWPSPLYGTQPTIFRAVLEVGPPVSPCPADLNGDGRVGAGDLAVLLGFWGLGPQNDLDGDGIVKSSDLAVLLGSWGPCA